MSGICIPQIEKLFLSKKKLMKNVLI